jgi:hypothetical protein
VTALSIRVYVNERPIDLPAGADALTAVTAFDAALGNALATGGAYVTDGRGIRLDATMMLSAGTILRAVASSRVGPEPDALG